MAITHRIIANKFVQGYGLATLSELYRIPLATVEYALRRTIKRDLYVAPEQLTIANKEQLTIANKEQLTIAEVYGEIEIR